MDFKKIEAIAKEGVLECLIDHYDWFSRTNERAEYIFSTMFEDDTFVLSETGEKVVELFMNSIKNSCNEKDVYFAYENVKNKEMELNKNFYSILPKMFAHLLCETKALKQANEPVSEALDVSLEVVDYLGRQALGTKNFVQMIKEEVELKNKKDTQLSI